MVRLTCYYLLRIYYVTRDLTSRALPLSRLIFNYEAETYILRSAAIRIQDGFLCDFVELITVLTGIVISRIS